MSYNNLQNQQTSVSATWGTVKANGLSYSSVSLDSGVPHIDQLEIERVFTLDSAVQQAIDTYDLHQVFLLQKTEYTLNESTSKLTAFSITGSRTYTCTRGTLTNTQITIPVISDSDLVIVRRKTMSMTPYVSWVSGSRLTSSQLNQQVKQLLRLNQELIYKLETEYVRVTDISGTAAPSLTLNNDLNVNGYKIYGLYMPSGSFNITSNPQYAANKSYVDTNFVNLFTNQTIAGNKTLSSTLAVTGATTLSSTLAVTGATTLNSTLAVTGATTLSSTLAVTGATTLNSTLAVTGNLSVGSSNSTTTGRYIDLYNSGSNAVGASYGSILRLISQNVANTSTAIGQLVKYQTGAFSIENTETNAAAYTSFSIGGSERMRIDASGNVGIGASSSGGRLHSEVNSADYASTGVFKNAQNGAYMSIAQGGGTSSSVPSWLNSCVIEGVPPASTSGNTIIGSFRNNLVFHTNSRTERMRIDSSGNVGINTSNPATTLDVNGTATISGITKVTSTASSTSSSSGALVVSGGVGIAGALYGNQVNVSDVNTSSLYTFNSTTLGGNQTTPTATNQYVSIFDFGTTRLGFYVSYGTPNSVISAPKGSLCINVNGSSTITRLYINTNGTTGWTHIVTGA